jgi:outer membrane receptor protein involved in Fe transport
VDLTPFVLPSALNIGDGYSRGLELELEALLTQHLTAHVDYTYDQTKFSTESPLLTGTAQHLSFAPPRPAARCPGHRSTRSPAASNTVMSASPAASGAMPQRPLPELCVPSLSATVPTVPGYTMLDTRLSYARTHWVTTLYATT